MPFCDQGSSDRKQYLNLSMEAWEIINYDQCRFASTDSKGPKLPLSTFLNQIFQNFYETADASIALQAENHAQKLREILSDGEDRSGLRKKSSPSRGRKPGRTADSMENSNSVGSTNNMNSADSMDNMNSADSTNSMDRTIEKLTAAYVEKLREKSTSYAKGKGEKFRLNQENFSYLTDEDSECQEELFYSSIGQYLKALFEEYASLTHLQREAVYYRSVLETIQQAFDSNSAVRVTHVRGFQFEFQPYRVLSDLSSTYHYLIGYSTPLNMDIDYDVTNQPVPCRTRPATMRISNIADAKVVRRKSGKLTARQKEELKTILNDNGPQFMADDTHEIHIHLTPDGISRYNYQLALRPEYTKIIEPDIYVFRCSERQIEYYFFNFGKDAEILKPENLRKHFARRYREAAEGYKKTDT